MNDISNSQDESFRFDISISKISYNHKPTDSDYSEMRLKFMESLTVDDLLYFIKKGHIICHVFNENRRLKKNFLYTYTIFVDVDNSDICMSEFINDCSMEPTLAYTTSSNGMNGKGYRYRLIYVFNQQIKTES